MRNGNHASNSGTMDDAHYRALLDLIMVSDPWPDGVDQDAVIALADEEAKLRGFDSWVIAYFVGNRISRAVESRGED